MKPYRILELVKQHYDINFINAELFRDIGWGNSTYKIYGPDKEYFLRLIRQPEIEAETAVASMDIQKYLFSHGFPVVPIYPANTFAYRTIKKNA
jgi:hypothetical protein